MSPADGDVSGTVAEAAPRFGPYAFTLTKQDFAAFALRMGRRQAMRHEQRYGLASALALLGATLAALGAGWFFDLVERGPALWLFPAAALALALAKLFTHRQIARAQKAAAFEAAGDEALFEGRREVTLDDDGVILGDESGRQRIVWAQVDSAERAGGLIILWTGLAGGVTLPERAFAGTSEVEACLAFAEGRIAAETARRRA